MKPSISSRSTPYLQCLASRNNAIELVFRILDLEDALCDAHESSKVHELETITIEEDADENGNFHLYWEHVWIDYVKTHSSLDVRAILSDLPTQIGLYQFDLVYKEGKEIKRGVMKVWVVPQSKKNTDNERGSNVNCN